MLIISAALVLGGPVHVAPIVRPVYSSSSNVSAGISYSTGSRYGSGWLFWLQSGNPYPPLYAYHDPYYEFYDPYYEYLDPDPVYASPAVYYVPVVVKKPKPRVIAYRPWPEIVYVMQPYAYRIDDYYYDDYYYSPPPPVRTRYVVERPVFATYELPQVKFKRVKSDVIFVQAPGSRIAWDAASPKAFLHATSMGSIQAQPNVSVARIVAPKVRGKVITPKSSGKAKSVVTQKNKGGMNKVSKPATASQRSNLTKAPTQVPQPKAAKTTASKGAPVAKGQKSQTGKAPGVQKASGKKK